MGLKQGPRGEELRQRHGTQRKKKKVVGTPWKPHLHSEDDKFLSKEPQPALDKANTGDSQAKESDESAVPRSCLILRKDLVNHGYTPGCQGCYAAANDRKHKPHTPECRERIAKALMGDDKESHRIKDARDREDAFLENAVRQGDLRQNKEEEDTVQATPITPTNQSIGIEQHVSQPATEDQAPISYEDILMENDFHDAVNQGQAMYDDINSVPDDSDNMIGSIIGIVQKHVSEVLRLQGALLLQSSTD